MNEQKEMLERARDPIADEKCGCGKPVRYMVAQPGGVFACNKYMRCLTYDELSNALKEANMKLSELARRDAWVEINSTDDLPTTEGRYFLLIRYIPDGSLSAVGSGFAPSERSPWAFIVSRNAKQPKPIVEAVAWMEIPPFRRSENDG